MVSLKESGEPGKHRAHIIVDADASSDHARAASLAESLGLPLGSQGSNPSGFSLYYDGDRLLLASPGELSGHPFTLDFAEIISGLSTADRSRKQPLAKAVGPKHQSVWDLSAGFAQDALLLTGMGYDVCALERNPVVHALLHNAWQRLQRSPVLDDASLGSLKIIAADAMQYLQAADPAAAPDVIYMDPMYPPKRKKSAQVRKPIRILRKLVGNDDDAANVAASALQFTKKRLVVKRPVHAEPLLDAPDIVFESKLVRYDVYLRHQH